MKDHELRVKLCKYIANKTRLLLPQSANRVAKLEYVDGKLKKSGSAPMTLWRPKTGSRSTPPLYHLLQISAMYARSSRFAYEKAQVLALNMDMKAYPDPYEQELNKKYLAQMKLYYGWNETKVKNLCWRLGGTASKTEDELIEGLNYKKTHHKPTVTVKRRKKTKGIFFFLNVFKTHYEDVKVTTPGKAVRPLERLEQDAKNAIRFRVGNCDQTSALAFLMFMEFDGRKIASSFDIKKREVLTWNNLVKPWPYVERIVGNGHCMVVLGRDITKDVNDFSSYKEDGVVVCDPWWFHQGGATWYAREKNEVVDRSAPNVSQLKLEMYPLRIKEDLKKRQKMIDQQTQRDLRGVWEAHIYEACKGKMLVCTHKAMLGVGHSARFKTKDKDRGLSYMYTPTLEIRKLLDDLYRKKYSAHFDKVEKLKKKSL
jgi:hypothetical protein